jgi:hypothetical protein
MGNFFGSTQIRTDSMEKVKEVLKTLCQKEEFECYLSPSINGWVGVYNNMNGQAPLGDMLAEHFEEDIISLLVHDDDFFCYWYYKKGKLIDQYNSCPDYFGEGSDEEPGGNPEVFRDILKDDNKIQRLEEILTALEQKDIQNDLSEFGISGKPSESMQRTMNFYHAVHEMGENPGIFVEIANQLNIPLKDKFKELFEGLESDDDFEARLNLVIQNQKLLEEMLLPIYDVYLKQSEQKTQKKSKKAKDKKSKKGISKSAQPPYVFAGEQLRDFAEVLNIKNTQTYFEYLQQGETDGIVDWEKFVKLP